MDLYVYGYGRIRRVYASPQIIVMKTERKADAAAYRAVGV